MLSSGLFLSFCHSRWSYVERCCGSSSQLKFDQFDSNQTTSWSRTNQKRFRQPVGESHGEARGRNEDPVFFSTCTHETNLKEKISQIKIFRRGVQVHLYCNNN